MSKLIIKKQYSPEPRDIYFTVPNFISLLRIISIPFIAMLVSHHRMVTALVVLALSAISDGLDGLIARSFNQVSKIGQILDPIADRLLIFCSILALGVANIIPWWMLIVVGLRDLIMAGDTGFGAARLWPIACSFRRQGRYRDAAYRHRRVDLRRHLVQLRCGYTASMRSCHRNLGRWTVLACRVHLHAPRHPTVEERYKQQGLTHI